MTDIVLIKTVNGALIPADPQAAEFIGKLKLGAGVTGTFKKQRNHAFHKKFFALLNLAYDAWEPEVKEYRGLKVQKNFERFRKDIIIACGYYDVTVNLKGDVRAEAKSISFGKMDDYEFAELYSKAINVILSRILTNYTRDDLDRVVEELMHFAG